MRAAKNPTPPADLRPPIAVSYLRFSTPDQRKGDSLRRQTEATEKWCETHGIPCPTKVDVANRVLDQKKDHPLVASSRRGVLKRLDTDLRAFFEKQGMAAEAREAAPSRSSDSHQFSPNASIPRAMCRRSC